MDHHHHHHHPRGPSSTAPHHHYSSNNDDDNDDVYDNVISSKISDNQPDLLQSWPSSQDQFLNLINVVDGSSTSMNAITDRDDIHMDSNMSMDRGSVDGDGGAGPGMSASMMIHAAEVENICNDDLTGPNDSNNNHNDNSNNMQEILLYPRLSVRELLFADQYVEAWPELMLDQGLVNHHHHQQQQHQQLNNFQEQVQYNLIHDPPVECEHDSASGDPISSRSSAAALLQHPPPLLPQQLLQLPLNNAHDHHQQLNDPSPALIASDHHHHHHHHHRGGHMFNADHHTTSAAPRVIKQDLMTLNPNPNPNSGHHSISDPAATFNMQQMIVNRHEYGLLNPSCDPTTPNYVEPAAASNPNYPDPPCNSHLNQLINQQLITDHQLGAANYINNINMLLHSGNANLAPTALHQRLLTNSNADHDLNMISTSGASPSSINYSLKGSLIRGGSFVGNAITHPTRSSDHHSLYLVNPHLYDIDLAQLHHDQHQQALLLVNNSHPNHGAGSSSSGLNNMDQINTTTATATYNNTAASSTYSTTMATSTNPQYGTMLTNHPNIRTTHTNQSVHLSDSAGSTKLKSSRMSSTSSMEADHPHHHDRDNKEVIVNIPKTATAITSGPMPKSSNLNNNIPNVQKQSILSANNISAEEYNYKRSKLETNSNSTSNNNNSSSNINMSTGTPNNYSTATPNNPSTPSINSATSPSANFKSSSSSSSSASNVAPPKKEKLGERITTLQQLVSPFGKTDTASVLLEAIGYIKFLQEQVQALSLPYLKGSNSTSCSNSSSILQAQMNHAAGNGDMMMQSRMNNSNAECEAINSNVLISGTNNSGNNNNNNNHHQNSSSNTKNGTSSTGSTTKAAMDLRSRGLCLVPLSYCTSHVIHDMNGADYWSYGGAFR